MRNQAQLKLIGPFEQLLTMNNLPLKGAISDESLEVIPAAGLLVENGIVKAVSTFSKLQDTVSLEAVEVEKLDEPMVCLPGFIDAHTHICYAGSRARDYAMRVAGMPYLEIAKAGGGILESVTKTRQATQQQLESTLSDRCDRHFSEGVTTCEVKSGYALNIDDELKMLRAINALDKSHALDLIPTCLAAHMPPKDFQGTSIEYLDHIAAHLLPKVSEEMLSKRVDIFIEDSAFTIDEAGTYLAKARQMGFSLTMHVDQFTPGSSLLACKLKAVSADHLEASTETEIIAIADSDVVAVVLPGASLGLGYAFAPVRKLLDAGACVAISTDWNPGSAPMGDLLLQAAILGAAEKLTEAETFAGITFRAARALELHDRGVLAETKVADFVAFRCDDHREILYQQGKLKPNMVWKKGNKVSY
ncbi:MAG: imidazolonepropionase [Caldithrix sp.]|nr:MAG: imidazolonepropionase [Caldithrix sp.]